MFVSASQDVCVDIVRCMINPHPASWSPSSRKLPLHLSQKVTLISAQSLPFIRRGSTRESQCPRRSCRPASPSRGATLTFHLPQDAADTVRSKRWSCYQGQPSRPPSKTGLLPRSQVCEEYLANLDSRKTLNFRFGNLFSTELSILEGQNCGHYPHDVSEAQKEDEVRRIKPR